RNEVCQLLPRKFKVAFTANDEDRAITLIHDLGFVPRMRDGVRGVEIGPGGGTSIMARVGQTLFDFVEVDNGDYIKVSEAVLRIFDRQDWLRANRARARLKFLVDKIGIDEFRQQVEEELAGDWVSERDFDPTALLMLHDEQEHAPPPPATYGSPNGDGREFRRCVESMNIEDPLSRQIHIKMSGCPNGCGQHHIGSIGFYGASMKVGDRQIPAYIAHVGGRYDGGEVAYGHRLKVRLPAKRVPDAV